MNQTKRIAFLSKLRAENPAPKTELRYDSNFQLLIAVMLSAQSTDVGVNKATLKLFPVAGTPKDIAKLGVPKLKGYIKTIGLFNTKAENIIKTCNILLSEHNGEVPTTRAELEALPGVGRKTANVVLNTAFGAPTMAVDTHIYRVSNRTRFAPGKTVLQVEKKLLKVIPDEFIRDAHHWLILHGRYICTARSPRCAACVVFNECEYPQREKQAQKAAR